MLNFRNMSTENVQSELNSLKARVKKLEYDFKTVKLAIDEHCSHARSKIDVQAETKIKEVHERRL